MSDYFLVVISRCRNETMMLNSFIPYYLSQGVDKIFLLDDASTEPFSNSIKENPKVKIIEMDPKDRLPEWKSVDRCLYKEGLREKAEWVMTIDCDEFITTRRNKEKTIREELIDNFSKVSCIKIPWVMFVRNGRIKNPQDVILETCWRYNHNLKHLSRSRKFNDRSRKIEVKCIWRPSHYRTLHVHFPYNPTRPDATCVDGIDNLPALVNLHNGHTYDCLNEEKIARAYFTCNHYRIVSEEHARQKCNQSSCTKYRDDDEKDILKYALECDYPEIEDNLLKTKYEKKSCCKP